MSSDNQIVDISRVRVQTPNVVVHSGRFLFHNGRAAVWVIDKRARTATRVLFTTNSTFVKAPRGRNPHTLTLFDNSQWLMSQVSGGCGCSSNPIRGYSTDDLLSDDLTSVP